MITYKLQISSFTGAANSVTCSDGWTIPFDSANTDYQNFKYQINHDEAQLEDADGNVMTPEAAKAYVATLP
jgi:hypothetical protein